MSAADLSLLKAVLERIATPGKWTQGASARTWLGTATMAHAPEAARWCLSGACRAEKPVRHANADRLATLLGFSTTLRMIQWNDAPTRTHAEVLSRIEDAIKRLEGE